MNRTWARWTTEQDGQLARLYAAGATLATMADVTGHSEMACERRATDLGLTNRFTNRRRRENVATYTAPASDARKSRQRRPCLCCGRTFYSEGPHHRMCINCRRKSLSPLDIPVRIGR
jgi:hypothetical protein